MSSVHNIIGSICISLYIVPVLIVHSVTQTIIDATSPVVGRLSASLVLLKELSAAL
jgi:hypothetical protein